MEKKLRIGIVDYGIGNIRSIVNALTFLGNCDVVLSGDHGVLKKCDGLLLPGVGSFALAMRTLKEKSLIGSLNDLVLKEQIPILAICLGMQMLFDSSEEDGGAEGLGWIPGKVVKFDIEKDLHVPHMGWNDIVIEQEHDLVKGLSDDRNFYFVHSYHAVCARDFVVSYAEYGKSFPAVVCRRNIFGAQFHPEKSQGDGLTIMRNFVEIVRRKTLE